MPFHGRSARAWILGSTTDLPPRLLQITKVVSPVRYFDGQMLELARWVGERYVAPLAAVIGRTHPPRVASEERPGIGGPEGSPSGDLATSSRPSAAMAVAGPSASYRGGRALLTAIGGGGGTSFVLRPAPEDEQAVAVDAVGACLAGGRCAVVLVPEADPVPATATALLEAFGRRVAVFLGGDRRERYRMWLDVRSGTYDVVVGTRPAVFAPIQRLGLIFVSRESHRGHREERSPYYHVRDVALARARMEDATCVLSSLCPSTEASALRLTEVVPRRREWPPVEVVKPGPEGRAPRLIQALRVSRRAFVYAPIPGSGVARICRSCREPAACAACGGLLRAARGEVRCVVCEARGTCRSCGSTAFGIRPGGAERVEAWARRIASVPVHRPGRPRLPADAEVVVGGPEAVRDLGPGRLDLVAILDADLAGRRPGVGARERALVTWFEVAGLARPNGRVIVQASRANDVAVQALVRGNPDRFHADESRRRADAGFPVGAAVFRVIGTPEAVESLERLAPRTILVSSGDEGKVVCLIALAPGGVGEFGRVIRELAGAGAIDRVEAEPHL